MFLTVSDESQFSKSDSDRSSGGFCHQKPKPPRFGNNLVLFSFDSATFGIPLLRSIQILPRFTLFLAQLCLNTANLNQIYSNSAKTPISPTLTWPNLVRSNQISAKIRRYRKTQNQSIHTRKRIRPNSVDLKLHSSRLQVELFST